MDVLVTLMLLCVLQVPRVEMAGKFPRFTLFFNHSLRYTSKAPYSGKVDLILMRAVTGNKCVLYWEGEAATTNLIS